MIFYENTLIRYLKSSFLDMSCIIWLQVVAVVYLTLIIKVMYLETDRKKMELAQKYTINEKSTIFVQTQ